MTNFQVDDNQTNQVPIDDTWSWNPIDWYLIVKYVRYSGIVTELKDFHSAFEMTERKKVLYRAVAGEGLVLSV
jgi:hypothetical protein